MAQLEHVTSPGHVHIENSERIVEIVLDTDDRSEVKNRVDAGSQGFLERGQVGDIALHESEVGCIGRSQCWCRGRSLRSRRR